MDKSLNERLREMAGKVYFYNTHAHKVLGFEIKDDQVVIITNKRDIVYTKDKTDRIARDFLPVDGGGGNGKSLALMRDKTEINKLKDVIMDNIEKVQKDKGYVKQADSVNRSIGALMSMAKTEIMFLKMVKDDL